jgi:AcrR family transcriptional regulator
MPPMLTRDTIVTTGLTLIDEGGPQNLTMRRLAERLGVTATALYHHVDDRQQLLDLIVDGLCAEIVAELPARGHWTDRLRAVLGHWYERVAEHPVALGWAMVEYATRPPVLRFHEAVMEVLDDAGFEVDAALHVKGALMRYCLGHLMVDELRTEKDWRGVPEAAFPHYRAAGPASQRFDPAEQFRIGIQALLDGLAASRLAP